MNDYQFFSIDRLVEFGLSMAIAQQMVGMMNQSLKSMYLPGSIDAMPQPRVYYVALDGVASGPLNDTSLRLLIDSRRINKDTLAWMPGMTDWQPISRIPEILKIIALTPPPLPE